LNDIFFSILNERMLTLGWATSTASSSTGTNRMINFFLFTYLTNQIFLYIYLKIGLVQKFIFFERNKKKEKNGKQAFDN